MDAAAHDLAGPEVAAAIEIVQHLAPAARPARHHRVPADLVVARTCYDHLAGVVAVAVYDHLVTSGVLAVDDQLPRLTPAGVTWCTDLGIDVDQLAGTFRPLVRACLDWSERRHHLAGGVGAALADVALGRRWLVRRPRHRALRVTAAGREALVAVVGLDPNALDDALAGALGG